MSRRLRILLSAYACEPQRGSEPGVGWNQALQAARFHEVWIMTRANNRRTIEGELTGLPLPHAHWLYYDLPRWLSFWKKGQRGIHFYYYLWQIGAYRLARRLHKTVSFDLVHHVTFVNYYFPSLLALLPVPFVWGPVGGGDSAPRAFRTTFSCRGKVHELLRAAARRRGEHDPLVLLTARRAKLALAATPETARRLRRLGCANVRLLSDTALEGGERPPPPVRSATSAEALRVVSLGRLLHWKGFHLGLQAFAGLQRRFPRARYLFIGDGPERARLARLAARLRIEHKVRFLGAVPRKRALALLAQGDVLLHPSLHDSGGWACLEAMSFGLPVVCLDTGGPAVLTSGECAIRVAVTNPGQAVDDLTEALARLAGDRGLRRRMGAAGKRRVREHFSWERMGDTLRGVYLRWAGTGRAG